MRRCLCSSHRRCGGMHRPAALLLNPPAGTVPGSTHVPISRTACRLGRVSHTPGGHRQGPGARPAPAHMASHGLGTLEDRLARVPSLASGAPAAAGAPRRLRLVMKALALARLLALPAAAALVHLALHPLPAAAAVSASPDGMRAATATAAPVAQSDLRGRARGAAAKLDALSGEPAAAAATPLFPLASELAGVVADLASHGPYPCGAATGRERDSTDSDPSPSPSYGQRPDPSTSLSRVGASQPQAGGRGREVGMPGRAGRRLPQLLAEIAAGGGAETGTPGGGSQDALAGDGTAAGGGTGPPSASSGQSSEAQLPLESVAQRVFRQARPSVVNVSHSRSAYSFSSLDVHRLPQGQASGFIWDSRGHVVTCYHAVKGLAEVKVTLHDHSSYTAKLVGWDASKDVAVLRLSIPKSRLRELVPVVLSGGGPGGGGGGGGAGEGLQIGQTVWGVGNPYGLDHTLTQGIVSGLGRELPGGLFPIKNVIQTTAGCGHQAGGVLLDSKGHVQGVLAAAASGPGGGCNCSLGFAVPMDTIKGLVEQVLLYGRPMRPSLGITFAPPQVLQQLGMEGVLVLEVPHGSPAAQAGLRPTHRDIFGDIIFGDIVVGMEGRAVRCVPDLYAVLDDRRAGDRVKVDIIRDSKATSLTLTLGERGLGSAEE